MRVEYELRVEYEVGESMANESRLRGSGTTCLMGGVSARRLKRAGRSRIGVVTAAILLMAAA
jgi:hypothetical protein